MSAIQNFYQETGSNLCRYGFTFNDATPSQNLHHYIGPCPTLPVYESYPVLNRCFPRSAKELAEKVFTDFYDLLNSWDTIEQMLSDLYSSWKEMIICVIVAFSKYSFNFQFYNYFNILKILCLRVINLLFLFYPD